MSKRYHRYENQVKSRKKEIIFLIAFIVVCMVGMIVLYACDKDDESTPIKKEKSVDVVEIGGTSCTPKQNIETYLLMGVDVKGTVEEAAKEGEPGQSDVLILLVIDRAKNTYATLPIHRDTLTDVDSLDEKGNILATTTVQIALAHANGDGNEISCENTVKAVSNLLHGQKIDGYAAVNMDAITKLNHMVGGVTVTIEDDFSESDKTLKTGETVKLNDEQAYHYIHDRMNVGDGSNDARMRRQSTYMKSLKKVVKKKTEKNQKYPLNLFEGLEDYMVTTLTGNNISRISKAVLKNKDLGQFEIKGKNAIDRYGYNAFTIDKQSLNEVIIELFYDRVDEDK